MYRIARCALVIARLTPGLAEVRVEHDRDTRHSYASGAAGKFQLPTGAPALIPRKPDLHDGFLLLDTPGNVVVRPPTDTTAPDIAPCSADYTCGANQGIGGTFCLLKVAGAIHLSPTSDIDYVSAFYMAAKGDRSQLLRHMHGLLTSRGMPLDEGVWRPSSNSRDARVSWASPTYSKPAATPPRANAGATWANSASSSNSATSTSQRPLRFDRVLEGLHLGC